MSSALDSAVTEVLTAYTTRRTPYVWTTVEKEARWRTWMAYQKRNEGRLFPIGPHEGHEERHWRAMEDMWYGKAIGCVARFDVEEHFPYTFEESVGVGVFLGCDRGWLGSIDFIIGSFSGPGTSLHRSPLNIGFVHVLGEPFQTIVDERYKDEDGERWFTHAED